MCPWLLLCIQLKTKTQSETQNPQNLTTNHLLPLSHNSSSHVLFRSPLFFPRKVPVPRCCALRACACGSAGPQLGARACSSQATRATALGAGASLTLARPDPAFQPPAQPASSPSHKPAPAAQLRPDRAIRRLAALSLTPHSLTSPPEHSAIPRGSNHTIAPPPLLALPRPRRHNLRRFLSAFSNSAQTSPGCGAGVPPSFDELHCSTRLLSSPPSTRLRPYRPGFHLPDPCALV